MKTNQNRIFSRVQPRHISVINCLYGRLFGMTSYLKMTTFPACRDKLYDTAEVAEKELKEELSAYYKRFDMP